MAIPCASKHSFSCFGLLGKSTATRARLATDKIFCKQNLLMKFLLRSSATEGAVYTTEFPSVCPLETHETT
jgi:hypothetical protein